MPPRSATGKKSTPRASAKAKKPTQKSKKSVVEPTPADQNNNVELSAIKREESEATEDTTRNNQPQGEKVVTGVGKIKQEFVRVLEPKAEEEVFEEERDVEGAKGDRVEVKVESFAEGGERVEGVERENDTVYVADGTEKCGNADGGGAPLAIIPERCDNAAEESGAGGEQNEGRDGDNDGSGTQLATVPVAELYSCEEGIAAAQIGDAKALGDNNNALVIFECGDGKGGDEVGGMHDTRDSEEDDKISNEDEEHPSLFFDNHLIERRKENDLEIFIGRLDKGAVEDDLIKVFGKFGEIRSVRLARNPTTNRNRGYAFIKYATVEQAKDALSALKDGIQVGSKHVKISASQDKDTLYMGNICKLWTKERVLEGLKSYGIENIEEIHLPNDPQKEGKIRGFALLEFSTHSNALAAFQRLRKPDAVFGCDRSAKVAFAQTPMHPNEEVLSQVKTVYVKGLTDAWNERKLKENCKQFGEVVKVKLSRNLGTRRKYYGFVTFSSRESALACIKGINNACIGEGDVKVKASIAMPHFKGRLQKQGIRGGFKVMGSTEGPSTKEESGRETKAVSPKIEGHAKSTKAKKTAKMLAEEREKAPCEPEIDGSGKPNEHQTVTKDQFVQPSSKLEKGSRKRKSLHSEGLGKTGADHGHNNKRLKRQMGKKGRTKTNVSRKPKRHMHARKGSNYGADSIKYRNSVPGFNTSSVSYPSHAYATTMSGSKRPYADMEPHAGYLEPVAQKQGQRRSGYVEPPVTMHYQPLPGYKEGAIVTQSQPQTGYHEPARVKYRVEYLAPGVGNYGQPHAGYLEPAVGRHSRSHAVYSEAAVPNYSHDPYLRRAGEQDLYASNHSAYGSGYSLPPSYVPSYTYVGYEGGSSVSGHCQSSGGAHLPRRAYY